MKMNSGYYEAEDEGRASGFALAITFLVLLVLGTIGYSNRATLRNLVDGPVVTQASSTVYIDIGDKGHCSGVYLGKGLVLTAAHCDGDNADLTVVTDRGSKAKAYRLWVNKSTDLMLLSVNLGDIQAAHLTCAKPVVGQEVISSGNPYWAKFLRTYGHVSGADRSIDDTEVVTPLDITILPGMSGGPVFNTAGEVIGINDALMPAPLLGAFGASVSGIGFMVPSYVACRLMGEGRA